MAPPALPDSVAALAAQLAGLPGAVAVVLGGSRATGEHRPDSDWDLGLYYRRSRQPLDPDDVRGLGYEGHVSELGDWGPIVHGGAWLTVDGAPVDVLFRELDTIEAWLDDARAGRFEILWQNGCLVGAPTYLPVGELALCAPISGELPRPAFPRALADAAPARWQGRAAVALMFADGYARAGDVVCCTGMLANAVLATAHARAAQRGEWVLNEKRLVARTGLEAVQGLFERSTPDLAATVDAIRAALGADQLRPR
jgi:predicted nucleotidyltransferase